MRMAEVHMGFPALRRLHGGSRYAFERCVYRSRDSHANASDRRAGTGTGNFDDYEPWQLRVTALRILISRLLPSAHAPTSALRAAAWIEGSAEVELSDGAALLVLVIPTDVWVELDAAGAL